MPRYYYFSGLECGLSFLILIYSQVENYWLSHIASLKGTWILESQNWSSWNFSYKHDLWRSIKPNEPLKQGCWKNKNYPCENWWHSIWHVIGINKYHFSNFKYLTSLYPVPLKDRGPNKIATLYYLCGVYIFFIFSFWFKEHCWVIWEIKKLINILFFYFPYFISDLLLFSGLHLNVISSGKPFLTVPPIPT